MDDGDLHTGIVPGDEMFGNEKDSTDVQEQKEEQQAVLEALLPSVEVMKHFVDEEEEAIADIRSYLTKLPDNPDGQRIQDEFRARELYIGFLRRFRSEMIRRVTDYQESSQ